MVVSKKVHKSAVVRNRIRRRIYEIVRTELSGKECDPYDLVIIAYNDQLAAMPFDQLQRVVVDLLLKAQVVSDSPSTEEGHGIVVPKEK